MMGCHDQSNMKYTCGQGKANLCNDGMSRSAAFVRFTYYLRRLCTFDVPCMSIFLI
jgi:hypothetical protein